MNLPTWLDGVTLSLQLAPWQQSLHNFATKLAGVLGLAPVTNPVASDPDLMSQVTKIGPLTLTALADQVTAQSRFHIASGIDLVGFSRGAQSAPLKP